MLDDGTELPVVATECLEIDSHLSDPVYLRDDLYQSLDEAPTLRRHRDWEQVPSLRMLDEQVRVKEER